MKLNRVLSGSAHKCIYLLMMLVMAVSLMTGVNVKASDFGYACDTTDTMSDSQINTIYEKLAAVSAKHNDFDAAFVLVDDIGDYNNIQDFSDDFYDYYNYGENGALFMFNQSDNSWCVSTKGFGMTAFTIDGLEYIVDKMNSALKDRDYVTAVSEYANQCDRFLTQAENGEPFNKKSLAKAEPLTAKKVLVRLAIALLIGLIIALIVTGSMKSELKSVRQQNSAHNYVVEGSLKVDTSKDLFLYREVERTRIVREDGSGNGAHTSSSGETHGGTSGKL